MNSYKKLTFDLRPYQQIDRDWVLSANITHYLTVEKFSSEIEPAVVSSLNSIELSLSNPRNLSLIATVGSQRIGCVFLMEDPENSLRIKLFFLTEAFRGLGIGKSIVNNCVSHSKNHGFDRLVVSTFKEHERAVGLYQKSGFKMSEAKTVKMFGRDLQLIELVKVL